MDNTATELTAAILWTVGVVGLPFIAIMIAGAINVFVFGNTAEKMKTSRDPMAQISKSGRQGALVLLGGVLVGIFLFVLALIQAIEAWVAVAS